MNHSFRCHPKSDTSLAIEPNDRGLSLGHRARLCGAATIPHPRLKGLGRSSPFSHAPFEIFEVVVHLLKRESEREEVFRHVAGKTSREADRRAGHRHYAVARTVGGR